ncbi:PIN domain-containing protein [soil metagenome]
MTGRCFVDTNIFLYAASKDPADQEKKERARQLLLHEDVVISAQVLQEFFAAAVRKRRLGLSEEEAQEAIRMMGEFPVLPITSALVQDAIEQRARHQISYWDAAIVAAAQQLRCEVIYTEDLNHGQDFGTVVAQNPFRTRRVSSR